MTNLKNNNIELNDVEGLHQCFCCGGKDKKCTTIIFGASKPYGSFMPICIECKYELHDKLKVDVTAERMADKLEDSILGKLTDDSLIEKLAEQFLSPSGNIEGLLMSTFGINEKTPDEKADKEFKEKFNILNDKYGMMDALDPNMIKPKDAKTFNALLNVLGLKLEPIQRSGKESVIKDNKEEDENINFKVEDISDEVVRDIITKNFMADISVDGEIPNPTQIYPNPELLFITPEEENECDCNVCKVMKSKMYSASHREKLRKEVDKVIDEKNNNGIQLDVAEVLLEATDNILKQTFNKKAYESINRTSELMKKFNTMSEEEPECDCGCCEPFSMNELSEEAKKEFSEEMVKVMGQRHAEGRDTNDITGAMFEATTNITVRKLDKEVLDFIEDKNKKPAYKDIKNYTEKPKKEGIGGSNKLADSLLYPTFLVHPSPNTDAIVSFRVIKNRKEGK